MAIANQLTSTNNVNLTVLNTEENTFRVLQETLYPGSTDKEVAMILSYCKARRIDPILKPVHLVPMSVKTEKVDSEGKAIYERKNVIMPGIGLYRIDASRSGLYAGVDEPIFGEDVTEEFSTKDKGGNKKNSVKVTYPRWCKVTVRKILSDGSIAMFTAQEFWKENYATKSKWDECPNDMWQKRAYGQLAKCAEAQALRKAFPDVVGNEYTKEEMEGKHHYHEPHDDHKGKTYEATAEKVQPKSEPEKAIEHDIEKDVLDISWSDSVDNLKQIYGKAYKYWMNKKHKENMQKCVEAKDKKLTELEAVQNADKETGEIK